MATDDNFASKGLPGCLPGYGRPVNYRPDPNAPDYVADLLPNALVNDSRHIQRLTFLREFAMMQWMDEICSKPDWHVKVNNTRITNKWKKETIANYGADYFSPAMVDYCLAELRDRAKEVVDPSNPPPVLVFDVGVYRSDTAISEALKNEIQAAVAEFESRIPKKQKDWHPKSGEKVWDLVHPSLFPLVYGKTRILRSGQTTNLEDCISRCGEGDVIPRPLEDEIYDKSSRQTSTYWGQPDRGVSYSSQFQWLPCEVDITGPHAKIKSYINNLHPTREKRMYNIIEQVLTAAIPLWELTIARIDEDFKEEQRFTSTDVRWNRARSYSDDAEEDSVSEYVPSDEESAPPKPRLPPRKVIQPEPDAYMPTDPPVTVNLAEEYEKRGLQVIVKLANIELTPDKPRYEGGSWHVEGQLNEHIVATALYYYSNENVTQSSLAFRQQIEDDNVERFNYEQDDYDWIPGYFGVEHLGPGVQELGSVKTIEGRLLTFPNVLQHRVAPFQLSDWTKPGHRKIIALFLVDPNIKVISTAHVPCQQKEWWWELVSSQASTSQSARSNKPRGLGKLPEELKRAVHDEVDDFPLSLETAKELRLELMKERTILDKGQSNRFEQSIEFSLCEH